MTTDGLAGDRQETDRPSSAQGERPRHGDNLPVSAILDLCDKLLGEVGRRRHLFAWLRPPDSRGGDWLPVDAYYPGSRLVVVCRSGYSAHDSLFRELVPGHGLRLLELSEWELSGDPAIAERTLERKLRALGPPPRPQAETAREGSPGGVSRVLASLAYRRPGRAADAGAAPIASRAYGSVRSGSVRSGSSSGEWSETVIHSGGGRGGPMARFRAPDAEVARLRMADGGTSVRPGMQRPAVARAGPGARALHGAGRGLHGAGAGESAPARPASFRGSTMAGLALVIVVCAEVAVAVFALGIGAGLGVLALGVVLDAGGRALGTVAAVRLGDAAWGWRCAIVGSPAVAFFGLSRRSRRGPSAALAGMLGLLAMLVVVLGILAG